MASPINIYFEYRNSQVVQVPVNPKKLAIKRSGNNSKTTIIGLGDINILKHPGLKELSFESFVPSVSSGSYIQAGALFLSQEKFKDFFEALQDEEEAVNFVVSGLGINLKLSVESFEYWWEGGDPDMYYKLSLKEFVDHSVKIVELPKQETTVAAEDTVTNAPATVQPTSERSNDAKKVTVGCTVKVNGRLHRDSFGAGPGQTEKNATRKVNFIKAGRSHPYHVTTLEGGWRGWVEESAVEVIG